jgi:hypothetical protein
LSLLAALPARAHPGAHIHPHHGGEWLMISAALAAIAAAGTLAWYRSRGRK